MSLRFITKRDNDIYEHVPLPGIVMAHAFSYKEDSADLVEDTQTWSITGFLVAPEGSIQEQVDELTTFYEGGELDYARFQDDDAIVDEVPDSTGIKIVSLEFPEGDGPEWATKRKYVIVLEGKSYPTDITDSGIAEYSITYSTDQSGKITRTIRGVVKDEAGSSAYAKYTTLKSAQGWDTWADAVKTLDEYTQNSTDTECSFTVRHEKLWTALPSGVTNASVDYATRTDEQGVVRETVSGWFEGSTSDCAAAVANVYPLYSVVINYRVARNHNTNRTTFSISSINLLVNDILEYSETVAIDASIYDFVYHRVLGGAPPVRQITSRTPGRATQSGTCTRLDAMPPEPTPRWNPMYMKSHRLQQSSAEYKTVLGQYAYTLSWYFSYEFPITPAF
jgi:hypothetical protein